MNWHDVIDICTHAWESNSILKISKINAPCVTYRQLSDEIKLFVLPRDHA